MQDGKQMQVAEKYEVKFKVRICLLPRFGSWLWCKLIMWELTSNATMPYQLSYVLDLFGEKDRPVCKSPRIVRPRRS